MSDVTNALSKIEAGDPSAAEQLLPLVYEELRKLAAAKLAQEKSGRLLQAAALVHDAYIRLVDVNEVQRWDSRGHFFSAAAEAMRRILVDNARHHKSLKGGGGMERVDLPELVAPSDEKSFDVQALDHALLKLESQRLYCYCVTFCCACAV